MQFSNNLNSKHIKKDADKSGWENEKIFVLKSQFRYIKIYHIYHNARLLAKCGQIDAQLGAILVY